MTRIRSAVTFLCCCLVASGLARADEAVLDYQVVTHVTEVHSLPIRGRSGHEVGIAAFRGLAIFEDGRIAHHAYAGGFNLVDGSGEFQGYAVWAFEDDARLEATYVGEAKAAPDGGITFTGTYADVTGTGRYADLRGNGTFTGHRVDLLTEGGDTYLRGTLTLRPASE